MNSAWKFLMRKPKRSRPCNRLSTTPPRTSRPKPVVSAFRATEGRWAGRCGRALLFSVAFVCSKKQNGMSFAARPAGPAAGNSAFRSRFTHP
ncbi:hypothetical protein CBM2600_A120612 [Cupriavidus taiwanensis]|nr:hypothetical protein CBM2600_A120612 [Cupriavidus taiwanensis]